jgi:protoporphyrinogen oxidase
MSPSIRKVQVLIMKQSHSPVVIVGAGLTGMSAALHLEKLGVAFRIFERGPAAGGHATTTEDEGFRFDKTGHLLHLRDAGMRDLVMGLLGDDWVQVKRRSVVWSHGVYTRYPYQANTFGLPPEIANECLLGFIKAHFQADKPKVHNFEEFCLAHFGEGISRHFMIPYNARLWGVHPSEITADWCQRFVPMPKLEDVVAGAVGLNDRELGYNTSFVYPRLGIGELPKGMAKRLPQIEYNRAPLSIDVRKKELRFADEVVTCDVLITTAPMKDFLRKDPTLPADLAIATEKLRCNPLYYLDVAARVPSGTDHHWVYVPESKYPFYRLGCYSHFSEAMAPNGSSCFYVELSDRSAPNLEAVTQEVVSGMIEMGILKRPEDLQFARLRKIEHAYVVFDHAYFDCLNQLLPFFEAHKVISTGRYGGWNYSSMEDALIFGRDAAEKAQKLLGV